MSNLIASRRVHDSEASVDVPFVVEDTHHNIDLDVFNTTDVAGNLPRELVVGSPCGAHAEEGGVSDGLGVGGDAVVFLPGEVDMSRF